MAKATLRNDTQPQIHSLDQEEAADAKALSQEGQRLVERIGCLCGRSPATEMQTSLWISPRCPQLDVPKLNVWCSPEALPPLRVSVSMMPPPAARAGDPSIILLSFSFPSTLLANHQILPIVPRKSLRIIPLKEVMHVWGQGAYGNSLFFPLNH